MVRRSMWLVIFVATLSPAAAAARQPDGLGIYFDAQGIAYSTWAPAMTPFTAYLVLTDPLAPLGGFECTVTRTDAPLILLSESLSSGGVDADPTANGYAVSAPSPYPVTAGAVVLATWQYLPLSSTTFTFFLGAATHPTLPGGLPVLTMGGAARLCPVSSCWTGSPVAYVNLAPIEGLCYESGVNVEDTVTVSTAGLPEVRIQAGTRARATDGQDLALDFPAIVATGSPFLTASFEHPDWAGGPRFRADFRARYPFWNDYRVWPILVETDVAGTVTLDFWSNWVADPPLLHDLQTGAVRFFPYGDRYSFTNDGVPRSYRFELYEGNWRSRWNVVGVPNPATGAGDLTASPNPFNPRTTLRFDLPRAGGARLAVYDLAGRLVRTLVEGSLPQGANEIAWDGRDAAGRAVGSGAYVARLTCGGAVTTARLALLR